MKKIALTKGYEAIVDDHNYEWLSRYKWQVVDSPHSTTQYARRHTKRENGKQGQVWMHREIAKAIKGEYVDHVNHNGLCNLESNLRKCSKRENRWNSRKRFAAASQFKGVQRRKDRGQGRDKWVAKIKLNGKRYCLCTEDTEEDAAIYYNVAAQLCFGPYAYLNPV